MGLGGFIPLVTYSIQNTAPTPATFTRQNPYLGLKSFELEQAEYFGGREKAILELTARLTNSRFLTVIGASGCGKSSLVKAGLFPQLMRDRIPGSSQWATQSITPGEDALERLVETLSQLHGQNKPFVLFIDQFEEIFTLCKNDEQRTSFFHLMAEEEKNLQHQGRLIVAVRGDFLDRCAEYPEIAQLINRTQPTTYMVEPLSREELQEAITKPAQLHSVTFEPGLVSQMAEDVARQPGALPLLQYALRELWRVCIEESEIPQSCLTWQGYEKIGRVTGALETQANLTYESFISEADKDFVRKLFLELVELSNDGETVTRRRVTKSSLEAIADSLEQLDRVVGKLAKLRLIVVTTEKKGEGEFQTYAEVTHEALLSKWELLKGWIAENRENIRLERRFEADFQEWKQRHQKSEDALLTGARLTDIADWMQKTQPRLSTEEQEYIQRSLARRDRQLKAEIQRIELQLEQERKLRELSASRQKEAEQKTRIAITSLCGLTLLATSTLGYWIQAEQHKNRAIQALISEPIQLFKINNQLEAMIASVKALEELRKVGGGTEHAVNKLKTSVIDKSRESNRLQDHQGAVLGVSFSPDGKTIASASGDQTIKLWSLGGEVKETLSGHTKGVWNVIFSPMEGNMIASAGIDTTVRLWNAETGQQLKTLTGHKHPVYGMSFRPDSKVIATSSEDGTIKLWDTATGNELETLEKLPVQDNIYSVDFSRDGKTLASIGYKDGSVKLWNLETRSSRLIGRHQETGLFVKFSPNGQVLASSSNDGVIKLWNDGQPLPDIKAHEKPIYELAFSPDSETIVSASSDESIKLWKLDGTLIDTLIAKSGEVYSISASLNQEDYLLIASAGEDTSVRLWKISFNDKFDWFAEGANPQEAHRQAIAQLEQRLGINPKLDALGYQVYSRTIFDRLSNSSLSVTSIVVENNREEISRKRCPTCKPPKRCHLED
jgi:WD40 repeat protein/energy-coupling factor transporter ATP-binding protein EcfA2